MARRSAPPASLRRLRRAAGLACIALIAACGARSQLGAPLPAEAGPDPDGGAGEDAPPPVDVSPDTPPDTPPPFDCVEAGITYIYVITSQNELYRFYPPTLTFTPIGKVACPDNPGGAQPFSMAVSRDGTAYSVFTDGHLFQIDTADASCQATSYVPAAPDAAFYNMGMGFVGDPVGETLYVADAHYNANSLGLATIDTQTFARSYIANFQPELPRCELTGTGDGRLFAFCVNVTGSGSQIAEIDRSTAKVISVDTLALGDSNDAFAYAFWGGYFWIFTAKAFPDYTTVTRYDPLSHIESNMTTLDATIVGAGVSTCAPQ